MYICTLAYMYMYMYIEREKTDHGPQPFWPTWPNMARPNRATLAARPEPRMACGWSRQETPSMDEKGKMAFDFRESQTDLHC